MAFKIERLQDSDEEEWMIMWKAYLDHYKTSVGDAQNMSTFRRIVKTMASARDGETPREVCGLILRDEDGVAQGIVTYLFHVSTWTDKFNCYLSDLYVHPACRGKGYGKALIRAVEAKSIDGGSSRLYWFTSPDNATARRLYDSVAFTDRVVYKINH